MVIIRNYMEQLAKDAGLLVMEDFFRLSVSDVNTKATAKDIVTFADRHAEDFIISRIHETFPEDNIFGEERGDSVQTQSPVRWIIDPIDGTAAFERGQLYYSISIAREVNGKLENGVVYAPRLNELFYGESGKGAFLNGQPIHVSDRSEWINCTCSVGFACLRANRQKNVLPLFCDIAARVREVRRIGSAALDCCQVAMGRYDFYCEHALNIYDVAAGTVILREAGGKVTDYDGNGNFPKKGFLASNGIMHEKVKGLVLQYDYR